MATEDEIKAAYKKLDQAIEDFIEESGWDSAGVLTSWVMIGHQAKYDDDSDLIDTYPIWFKNMQQSHHINLGLLHAGLETVSSTFTRLDEES